MASTIIDTIRGQISGKLTVYVTQDTLKSLQKDQRDFEITDMSKLINRLIRNYVSDYFETVYSSIPDIIKILEDKYGNSEDVSSVAKAIAFTRSVTEKAPGKLSSALNFRLNKATIGKAAEALYNAPLSIDISAFFRSMFLSYLSLPVYRREQIIYKEEISIINKAIRNHEKLSYINKAKKKHHIFNPYSIETSSHEMFNYLIGQFDPEENQNKSSIRISNMANIVPIHQPAAFTSDFNVCLSAMKRNGIQFAMNDVIIRTVTLTDDQYEAYKRRYIDRPIIIEEEVHANKHVCKFDCSPFQLTSYFAPFDNAIVIEGNNIKS